MDVNVLSHTTDPSTSREAAANLNPTATQKVMHVIVDVLDEHGPMTPNELEVFYFEHREQWGWPVIDRYSVKRRVSELKRHVGVLRGVGRRDRGELLNLVDNRTQAHADIRDYFDGDA